MGFSKSDRLNPPPRFTPHPLPSHSPTPLFPYSSPHPPTFPLMPHLPLPQSIPIAEIEAIAAPFMAQKESLALVVGIVQGDDDWVEGFGQMSHGSAISDGDIVFEIGSLTKLFTATLLSLLVERQELKLTTPINQLAPAYQQLPDTITLGTLATHTSGLPRLPTNIHQAIKADSQNPYAAYTREDLHAYLQSHDGTPGKTTGTISYSNLGAGILGNILADHLGQSYEEAVIDAICTPLGLQDTRVKLSDGQTARLAIGHSPDNKPLKNWDVPTLAGAGALRSTANDLLKFLRANLQATSPPLGRAIAATHSLQSKTFASPTGITKLLVKLGGFRLLRLLQGKPLVERQPKGIGLGWFVDYLPKIDQPVYWHNGGTGGYRSFCGFILNTQTGVVVLSNYGDNLGSLLSHYSVDAIGFQILKTLVFPQANSR
ncbi:MAG: serine hydrolase domain-containing protein [Cyanobacteria bacterium P01_C01_bin.70]